MPDPDAQAGLCRVMTYADRLLDALEDVEAGGGLGKVTSGVKASSVARLGATLRMLRELIDDQAGCLERPAADPSRRVSPGRRGKRVEPVPPAP